MNLKQELEQFLKDSGLKPYQLADEAKLPPSVVYRFLKGERDVMNDTAEKLRETMRRLAA